MITLENIIKNYGMPIPRKIRIEIDKYISIPEVQYLIVKALKYELTDTEIDYIYKIGNHKGQYPRLYYLCLIYIHPLTRAQNCFRLLEQIRKY